MATCESQINETDGFPKPVWCACCHEELIDEEGGLCGKCELGSVWLEWLEETIAEVEKLAADNGWYFNPNRYSGGVNTRSRYYELSREAGDDFETLKLRISDHGSCYCSEDVSLAMDSSGDDHTLDILEARLQ